MCTYRNVGPVIRAKEKIRNTRKYNILHYCDEKKLRTEANKYTDGSTPYTVYAIESL